MRRLVLGGVLIAASGFLSGSSARAEEKLSPVIQWNNAALQGIRDAKLGPPAVARALAIVHTCMYDAWAAYDEHAVGPQLQGALHPPAKERTLRNKNQALKLAANRPLVHLPSVD